MEPSDHFFWNALIYSSDTAGLDYNCSLFNLRLLPIEFFSTDRAATYFALQQ